MPSEHFEPPSDGSLNKGMPVIDSVAQVGEVLDELRAKYERGELMSIMCVAEHADGRMYMNYTYCDNIFQLAGYLMFVLHKRFDNCHRAHEQGE